MFFHIEVCVHCLIILSSHVLLITVSYQLQPHLVTSFTAFHVNLILCFIILNFTSL